MHACMQCALIPGPASGASKVDMYSIATYIKTIQIRLISIQFLLFNGFMVRKVQLHEETHSLLR